MLRVRLFALGLLVALAAFPLRAGADPHLPPDTELVVSINVRHLLNSDLFKKNALGPARDALKEIPGVSDFLRDIGFDPFRDLDHLTIASPANPAADRGLLIAQGKFDVAKIEARVKAAAKDAGGDFLKVHKVGDAKGGQIQLFELAVPGQDVSMFLAFGGATTLVASPGKDYVVEAVRRGRAKRALLLKNRDFQAMIERMDAKQTVSIALLGKAVRGDWLDSMPRQVKDALNKIDALGGGVTLTEDIRFEIALACKGEDDARALKETGDAGLKFGLAALALIAGERKELAAVLEVVKTLRLTAKGKVVTLRGKVDGDAIKDALDIK